jgi:predicted kinase
VSTVHSFNAQSVSAVRCSPSLTRLQPTTEPTLATGTSGELILIRGLPGSGKSTMARDLVSKGFCHFEADMYFEVNGTYEYDASRIRDAHNWCQSMTRQALAANKRVVVSNTFTQLREMAPYLGMTRNATVVEATGKWQSVHGVPAEILDRMAQRWETLPITSRQHTPPSCFRQSEEWRRRRSTRLCGKDEA